MVEVSILVLMDITLLRNIKGAYGDSKAGFNPCFNGYYTSTHGKQRMAI